MSKAKEPKSLYQIIKEMEREVSKKRGIIKQPEKKFAEWEKDFRGWDQRFTKRMTEMEKLLNEQIGKMTRYFE